MTVLIIDHNLHWTDADRKSEEVMDAIYRVLINSYRGFIFSLQIVFQLRDGKLSLAKM
jgi:hypothetical protein